MAGLIPTGGDGPVARCTSCRAPAVGPCARCRALVCGACCVLTDGASPFAVCLACARGGGATLAPKWRGLVGWLALIAVGIGGIGVLLYALRHALR